MKYRILKTEEYEKNKYILPNPGRRFWLDRGGSAGDNHCSFVNEEGMVDRYGTFCADTTLWLRPVIEYEEGEQRPVIFSEGLQVELYGLTWTAVSENILVCDRCVESMKFDDTGSDFENSYIKYALYQYFKGRTPIKELIVPEKEILLEETKDKEFSYSFLANLICIFIAAAAGVICTLSFSPISVSMFALVVVCSAVILGSYNIKKIKEVIKSTRKKYAGKLAEASVVPQSLPVVKDIKLETEYIEDAVVLGKTEQINKLMQGLMENGSQAAKAKVKFFYFPETRKTLTLYKKLVKDGIETENSRECMDIISDNLDKTIKLLTMEYDKSISESLLETKLSGGVMGKMLENAEKAEDTELKLR